MTNFILWRAYEDQLHGFLGEELICAVMQWEAEKDRWPWQLQYLGSILYVGERVVAARTIDEAKHLAEIEVGQFLRRTGLVPATIGKQLDETVPPRRDPEAERARRQWLLNTGWFDDEDAEPYSDKKAS